MVIAAVDSNKKDLARLVKFLRMVYPGYQVVMFSDPKLAAAYIWSNPIDVLFTEVAMPAMSGFALQERSEAVQPGVLTVFVTGTEQYLGDALKSRAQGYVLKPVTREALWEALEETAFGRIAPGRA